MRNLRHPYRGHSTAPAQDLTKMLLFSILVVATLGLSSAAFAHGLDVSASLFLPIVGDTATDAGERRGFVELQITEEIGEICWDIEFEGIEESSDLIIRSSPEEPKHTSSDQADQPAPLLVAPVTSGSADCVFRDIQATTETTLDVDAHVVELVSMTTGDVLLRGRLHKPLAPGFEATDELEPGSAHSQPRSTPWKLALALAVGASITAAAMINRKRKRLSGTS